MSPAQWERVPEALLSRHVTNALRGFLKARGWACSLYELDEERRRRGGTNKRKDRR